MSHIPTKDFCTHSKEAKEALLARTYALLLPYFKAYKNPKIFLFLMGLVQVSIQRDNQKIFFNIVDSSYEFDVCEKTIKSWLTQLEALKLIKFQYKKNQLYFVQLFDYRRAVLPMVDSEQKAIEILPKKQTKLPTRFYKNIQSIMKQIIKTQGLQDKKIRLHDEYWRLTSNVSALSQCDNFAIELQNTTCSRETTFLPYELITGKKIPSLGNPYHRQIIRANLKKSLKLLVA